MMKDRKLYTEIQDTNDLDKVPNNESAEYIISSDVSAILEHTNKVLFVEDDDIVVIKNGRISICHVSSKLDTSIVTEREFITLQMELDEIMKGKYKYYMEKEIYEQPTSILDTMRGRVDFNTHCVTLGGLKSYIQDIKRCRRLIFIACGTSYNSAIATRRIVEELTELPVNVELASDFHDRETPIFRDDVCFFISQSGETADTLMALDYCKKRGALLVGLTNTVGSSVSRQTNCGIHLNAGIEIGVASTKAYTSQVISLVIFSLLMSDNCLNKIDRRIMIIDSLSDLSKNMVDALKLNDQIKDLAKILSVQKSILLFGRGYDYSTCLEGALKIKELSYIHCEAILTGELKHGSLALIDKDVLSIMIISQDTTFKKSINSLQQISSRGCKPIIFTSADDLSCLKDHAKFIIQIPKTVDCLQPVINIIPLQLLAFHMACYLVMNSRIPAWRQTIKNNDDSVSIDSELIKNNCCSTCCSKPQQIIFLLTSVLIMVAAILHFILKCNFNYYCYFWISGLLFITSIVGFAHRGDYRQKFTTWCYIRLCAVTYVALMVAFMITFYIIQPTIGVFNEHGYDQYVLYFMEVASNQTHIVISQPIRAKICLFSNVAIVPIFILTFVSLVSVILVFHRHWIIHWHFTGRLIPFNLPNVNPYGQIIIAHILILVGSITVFMDSVSYWTDLWCPIWTGAIGVVAGLFTIGAMMRRDKPSTNIYSILFEILSFVSSSVTIGFITTALISEVTAFRKFQLDLQMDSGTVLSGDLIINVVQMTAMSFAIFLSVLNTFYALYFLVKLTVGCDSKPNTSITRIGGNATNYTSNQSYPKHY
ncbi:hypothetical protein A3Q56_02834 [Intoshia linei]|uniref:SIS domain-containing protein n=1 Tax=Intoshia linei TaxID=1819745 RepID=A0A177B6U1_9BILA|nr:hypothetical protein A3Q56_02834 [Intoshia linei]